MARWSKVQPICFRPFHPPALPGFVGHGPGDSNRYEFDDNNLAGRHDLSAAALHYIGEFLHDKKGKIKKKKGMPEWKEWRKKDEQFLVFDGDCQQAQLSMNQLETGNIHRGGA